MQLESESVLRDYTKSKQRLLVLGYNATLTTAVEAPRQPKRHFDQIQVCWPLASTHNDNNYSNTYNNNNSSNNNNK